MYINAEYRALDFMCDHMPNLKIFLLNCGGAGTSLHTALSEVTYINMVTPVQQVMAFASYGRLKY
jgi:hypothetical protein